MAGIFERKGEEEKFFRQAIDSNPHLRKTARVAPDGLEDAESIEDGETVQRTLQASNHTFGSSSQMGSQCQIAKRLPSIG